MGQDLSEKSLKISPYIIGLIKNSSKGSIKVQNYRQMGKNFERNFINSKKFIFHHTICFFTKYSAFGAILDNKLQSQILGARTNGIENRQGQVNPHHILYLFHVFILIFNAIISCLNPPKYGYHGPCESRFICSSIGMGIHRKNGAFPHIHIVVKRKSHVYVCA